MEGSISYDNLKEMDASELCELVITYEEYRIGIEEQNKKFENKKKQGKN